MIPAISAKLVAGAVGAAIVAAVLWWAQARIRVSYRAEHERDAAVSNLANYRALVARSNRLAAIQREKDEKADAALEARMTALQAENESIRRALSRLMATKVQTDAQGNPRVSIDPDWWLCVSAFVSRDAADRATCEARSSAGGVPDSVSR